MTMTAARARTTAVGNPHEALHQLAALPMHHPSRPAVRDQAIVAWLPLATDLAHRFAGRGEPLADLLQTATVGLIKAVDRFDVDRGTDFPAFAVPTIVGEVKRYFRDQTWDLHVPRRLQELRRAVAQATETLSQRQGRTPTIGELAAELEVSEAEIRDGLRVSGAYTTISLDAPATPGGDEPTATLGELLGAEDVELSRAELRMAVAPAVATLSERQQRILHMRFFGNLTQDQIARQIGISQMHVSRLLSRILTDLRERLYDYAEPTS
ncbi:SigB/SigF/SigG family RNA polymerase sigma factor [Natronosporangium hydrolyticum]|uniref:SigB/SigF/SigG family RNA polymerase sigma factor n=1 Tax=Natronosporangium hydrolyticum TaxID=2811111 RepID=A0A895YB91_9ACTN|nr:SigB/SigF/SigG family RNA polymerase sigma factor [Natronosporangium hydrolyticum]QSB12733.1 SigB/SigF/SigG family RNA polymerase sigma factor [Natronosporangium hydrolyticum]